MQWILASSSPRRKQLLKLIDFEFDIIHPEIDESVTDSDLSPEEFSCSLAELKSGQVSNRYPEAFVIGADTIVVKDGVFIGKPSCRKEAVSTLHRLSGCVHQVITGVSIQCKSSGVRHTFFELTHVTFKNLTENEIEYYVDHYSPYDKAGSYGIQDFSALFVASIRGCYHNVVGFPLSRFGDEIKKLAVPPLW